MGVFEGGKRKRAPVAPARRNKKLKRAAAYHSSSSEDDDAAPIKNRAVAKEVAKLDDNTPEFSDHDGKDGEDGIQLPNVDPDAQRFAAPAAETEDAPGNQRSETEDDEDVSDQSTGSDESDSADEETTAKDASIPNAKFSRKPKRTNPTAFATSLNAILNTKLTTTQRSDPILSRSKNAHDAAHQEKENKLEAQAKRKIKAEKRVSLEKGRVKDNMGLQMADVSTAAVVEEERRLKRTAQRGVVKLFNAVKAAQVQGMAAERHGTERGVAGIDKRRGKVNEMSKKGFLDVLVEGEKT